MREFTETNSSKQNLSFTHSVLHSKKIALQYIVKDRNLNLTRKKQNIYNLNKKWQSNLKIKNGKTVLIYL